MRYIQIHSCECVKIRSCGSKEDEAVLKRDVEKIYVKERCAAL